MTHFVESDGVYAALFQKFDQALRRSLGMFYRAQNSASMNFPSLKLACACSGGADSLLLTFFTSHWLKTYSRPVDANSLTGLIVDHGLRAESAQEARQTADFLAQHEIDSQILTVPPASMASGNVQHQARGARYRLMRDYCHSHDILFLLFGHHSDDMQESFLLNLQRGSGIYGLSAMASCRVIDAIHIIRPFLNVRKAQIRECLDRCAIHYIQDASNDSVAFARGRLRRSAGQLRQLGFGSERLMQSARHLKESREILDMARIQAKADYCLYHPAGFIEIQGRIWREIPRSVALKIFADAIGLLGKSYPPRYQKLWLLAQKMRSEIPVRGSDIAGVTVWQKDDSFFLFAARQKNQKAEDCFFFEDRAAGGITLAWLDEHAGIGQWRAAGKLEKRARLALKGTRDWLPGALLRQLPALFAGERLLGVPFFWENFSDVSKGTRYDVYFLPSGFTEN